ncbi:LOW QUALITY PROTEIN: probable ATP-dependent DNA helicase HFM1 [Branchiostoma floridae]|uniref:Probable ATP-dependent DNA helicase HFM1 n=1 Tax=Branchiostoma floridae TaxID=7739 RepID=A0A9J7LZP0_BRAFL|nr:LOW QUALITY PROTEIN: probable ATP-dependent DNA helicase HFM1 [Branchiostoma floridae]
MPQGRQPSLSNTTPVRYGPLQHDRILSESEAESNTQPSRNRLTRQLYGSTPRPLTIPSVTPGGTTTGETRQLRSVHEIPEQFRPVFKEFPYFNIVQSKVLDDVLYTDKPLVVCAPTGSGKTVIFELAIIRLLVRLGNTPIYNAKIVYMAPMKALCSERYLDWMEKFGPLGLKCQELTGDSEIDDYYQLRDCHIVLTTPEKWDSMTRKWRDNKSLVQLVRLFLIDEVHLISDENRGATMEAVVSRMKTIQAVVGRENVTNSQYESARAQSAAGIRFVAVSATIPNVEDVAAWLGKEGSTAIYHKMDESYRPVKLRKVILGYPCSSGSSEFRFDLSLNYKIPGVIQTYSDQKPTLVFCATRKGSVQCASMLVKDAKFVMNAAHKQRLQKVANMLRDHKLRDLVLFGVAYHHAGLEPTDRKGIETAFTQGDIPVLISTSTLAMGVNLPAHLVIIKSTLHYTCGMYEEYSELQVLQMIGRAGRPQFDQSATAVIMTRNQTKAKYEALVNGTQIIESSLHKNLIEHLNAEIVLHTINDVTVALEWIRSTFLYIRVQKNPRHYNIPTGLSREEMESRLQDMCLKDLNLLSRIDLVKMDEEGFDLKPTEVGRLMARYCITYDTMNKFSSLEGTESLGDLVNTVAGCKEFQDVTLRINERKTLNTLNKDKHRATVRFAMDGKIKTGQMKVNCLIQAALGCLPIQDFGLNQDTNKIFRAGTRVSKCLTEFLMHRPGFRVLLNATLLSKCFRSRLWENSKFVAKQLDKIGLTLATALFNASLTSFQKIEETNPREIELIVNRHPPFGNQVHEAVSHLPKYELAIEQGARYSPAVAELTIVISLNNYQSLKDKATAGKNHMCVLLIGDADNNVLCKQRLSDSTLMNSGTWTKKVEVKRANKGDDLSINFISQDYVGLDVQSTYTPFYSGPRRHRATGKNWDNTPRQKKRAEEEMDWEDMGTDIDWSSEVNENDSVAVTPRPLLGPDRKPCNHRCINKDACAHECCKFGVKIFSKTARQRSNCDTNMSSYLHQLHNRAQALPQTPGMKRLKASPSLSTPTPDLQQFSYSPVARRRLQLDKTASQVPATPARGWDHLDFYHMHREQDSKIVPEQAAEEYEAFLNDDTLPDLSTVWTGDLDCDVSPEEQQDCFPWMADGQRSGTDFSTSEVHQPTDTDTYQPLQSEGTFPLQWQDQNAKKKPSTFSFKQKLSSSQRNPAIQNQVLRSSARRQPFVGPSVRERVPPRCNETQSEMEATDDDPWEDGEDDLFENAEAALPQYVDTQPQEELPNSKDRHQSMHGQMQARTPETGSVRRQGKVFAWKTPSASNIATKTFTYPKPTVKAPAYPVPYPQSAQRKQSEHNTGRTATQSPTVGRYRASVPPPFTPGAEDFCSAREIHESRMSQTTREKNDGYGGTWAKGLFDVKEVDSNKFSTSDRDFTSGRQLQEERPPLKDHPSLGETPKNGKSNSDDQVKSPPEAFTLDSFLTTSEEPRSILKNPGPASLKSESPDLVAFNKSLPSFFTNEDTRLEDAAAEAQDTFNSIFAGIF